MWRAWAIGGLVFVGGLAALLLLHGGTPKLVEGSYAAPGDATWRENAGSELPARTLLLRYRSGQEASLSLSVRNDGGRAVRLVGASVLGRDLMFAPRQTRFEPTPADPRAVRSGSEVELPPDHETAVVLSGRFSGCAAYESGSETASRTLTVLYDDGGRTRALDVRLRNEIRVAAPDGCS
jgi:hypothetical protein